MMYFRRKIITFSSAKRYLRPIAPCLACILLIAVIASRIDTPVTENSKQICQDSNDKTQIVRNVSHPRVIVHLKDDLPPTNNLHKYKTTENIKNVISKFIKESEKNLPADRQHIGEMMVLNGSTDKVYYGPGDLGFFSTIYEAYNNHWAVRTVPDDWWYTIIRTVAIAIDKHSKKQEVRDYFVDFEGKNRIEVILDKILDSYRGNVDIKLWGSIFTKERKFGSGPSHRYDGWFLKDLLNMKDSRIGSLNEVPSGLVSVPLTFILEGGSKVKGALSSGIAGIKLDQTITPPVVEATHGWAIFAEKNLRI